MKSRQSRVTKEEKSGRVRTCSRLNTAAFCEMMEATFASWRQHLLHAWPRHCAHKMTNTHLITAPKQAEL